MQALFTTIDFAEVPPSTKRLVADIARRLRSVDGLKSTTWTRTHTGYAIWQLFEDPVCAVQYMEGPILPDIAALPDCTDVYIQQFTVADGLNFLSSLAESDVEERMAALAG